MINFGTDNLLACVHGQEVRNTRSALNIVSNTDSLLKKRNFEEFNSSERKKIKIEDTDILCENLNSLKFNEIKDGNFRKIVTNALRVNAYVCLENCCKFLSHAIDQKVYFKKRHIFVEISQYSENIHFYLTCIDRDHLKIRIKPSRMDFRVLKEITQKHSDQIIELDLSLLKDIVNHRYRKIIKPCVNLETLRISSPYISHEMLESIGNKIKKLILKNCTGLKKLSSLQSKDLRKLDLSGCIALFELPKVDLSTQLKEINLKNCFAIKNIPNISHLNRLEKFTLNGDTNSLKLKAFVELLLTRDYKEFIQVIGMTEHHQDVLVLMKYISRFKVSDKKLILKILDKFPLDTVLIVNFIFLFSLLPSDINKLLESLLKKETLNRLLLQKFLVKNKEKIEARFKNVDRADHFIEQGFIASKLGYSIHNDSLIEEMMKHYVTKPLLESSYKVLGSDFLLPPEFAEYLKNIRGQIFLNAFRNEVFSSTNSAVKNFVKKTFSPLEYPQLYPIQMIHLNKHNFEIKLCRKHLETDFKEIFERLVSLLEEQIVTKLSVKYYEEEGIDEGAILSDFIVNVLTKISKSWGLQNTISGERVLHFYDLGVVLRMILDNDFMVGDIFSIEIFKSLLELKYKEKDLSVTKMTKQRIFEISENLLNKEQRIFKNICMKVLSWDGSKKTSSKIAFYLILISTLDSDFYDFLNGKYSFDVSNLDYTKLYQLDLKDLDINIQSAIVKINQWLNQDVQKKILKYKTFVRKGLFEKTILTPSAMRVKNLQNLMAGLKYSQSEWAIFKRQGALFLQNRIQGVIDRDKVKDCLLFDLKESISLDQKEIFLNWLDALNEIKIRKFLKFTTGEPAIPLDGKISILRGKKFKVSSCFNQVRIPQEIPEELLLLYLEHTISDDQEAEKYGYE